MSYIVVSVLALLSALGCSDGLVSRRTQAMIERELDTARLSGFTARFATAETVAQDEYLAQTERPPNTTLLILHPAQGRLLPARDLLGALHEIDLQERVDSLVAPYLAFDDVDGAARALVRVYSELLRQRAGYRPTRALAPLMPPEAKPFRPKETAHWGIPLALLTALLAIRVMSRRAASRAQPT